MSIELWLAFAGGAAIIVAVPGPANLRLLNNAKGGKAGRTTAAIVGTVSGQAIAMGACLIVVGWLQTLSPTLAALMAAASIAVLLWFAVGVWRGGGTTPLVADNDNFSSPKTLPVMRHACAATTFDRKYVLVFAALAAQTISAEASFFRQVIILEAIFFAFALVAAFFYGLRPRRAEALVRKLEARKMRGRPHGKLRVTAGMVSVGYRRLAA